MGSSLNFANNEDFYKKLLDLESRREEYHIDTGIREVKDLPLRLLHHIGISKEDIAHKQHKVVEESDFMLDFVEPLLTKFNEMIGHYQPARGYEFTVEAEDFDTIKIHGRPQSAPVS
ncbi:MAG TPA: hypothetical protein VNQ79_22420 [Blastocatellia bacterium]|nr:hypothetical protein [Blastocatellia bacterium]